MRNIWLVFKHDLGVTIRQPSFWILTLLFPIILTGINAYTVLSDRGVTFGGADESEPADKAATMTTIGLVDDAGLIVSLPPELPADLFQPFPTLDDALAALARDEVVQVVQIPSDYVQNGEINAFDRHFQIRRDGADMGVAFGSQQGWILQYIISYNLSQDVAFLALLGDPLPEDQVALRALKPEPIDLDSNDQALAGIVASVMPYVFYFLLVMGGNYMMRSVVSEKENRTVELLLLRLEPRALMIGKITAMSAVVIVQVVVWVGSGVFIMDRSADLLRVAEFAFPAGFIIWALLFLVLGYLLYAAIMIMVGAMAPTAREGGQMIWLLIIPLMPTLMFGSEFLENPHGTLSLVLSLFPLSSPSAMVTRIAVAEVPLWQSGLSLGLLAATTYGFLLLAGHFFRSDNLISGASISLKRLVLAAVAPPLS